MFKQIFPKVAIEPSATLFGRYGWVTILIAAFLATLVSCSKSDAPPLPITEQIKANHVRIAYAAYEDSLITAKNLQLAIKTFLDTPKESTLLAAKDAYKEARKPYQQSEIMRWDTDITLLSDTGKNGIKSVDEWEGQVNAWPLNESLIDYVSDGQGGILQGYIIGSNMPIDENLLTSSNGGEVNGLTGDETEANVATGIHAIEFLLWGQDLNGTKPGAGERPASDYDLQNCTHQNCDRRRQYLELVTALYVKDLEAMVAEWSPTASKTKDTLANNFLHSPLAIDSMLLSMRTLASDELGSARMGSGLSLLDTEEEHDCFSDLSHIAIYYNFQGVKNAFYGFYSSPVTGKKISGASFAEHLKQLKKPLYEELNQALTEIEVNMAALYKLGEQKPPIRFDQIIGQGKTHPPGPEYVLANDTSLMLIQLDRQFEEVRIALSLAEIGFSNGDGD